MATWTAAELRDRVLEHLGVKAAGQSASAGDAKLVDEAILAAHARLRRPGLAPFPISAIPEWAQVPMRDFVAGDVGSSFGLGDSKMPGQMMARQALSEQVAVRKPPLRIRSCPY